MINLVFAQLKPKHLVLLGMSLLVKKQGFIPGFGIALGVCSNSMWIPIHYAETVNRYHCKHNRSEGVKGNV